MRRGLRHRVSPYGSGGMTLRLSSMILMVFVVAMLYSVAKDPATWRWLAPEPAPAADVNAAEPRVPAAPAAEAVISGLTDLDESERSETAKQFEAVSDRSELSAPEMPAYWRLMRWSNAQTFADLKRRAKGNVVYTQLWQDPEKFRGQLLKLRLHIKRIVEHPAPQNSADVKTVYEAWGWTDESKSFPYLVVFSELSAGMVVGPEVREEGEFVGYFLKTMAYTTFDDKVRAAPLLVGRMQRVAAPTVPHSSSILSQPLWLFLAGAGGVILVALVAWRHRRSQAGQLFPIPPADEATIAEFLGGESESNDPRPHA